MFENNLDSSLFLISLSSSMNKEKKTQLNLDAATDTVCTSVNKILVIKCHADKKEDILKEYICLSRRLHSIVFFGALRSCDIISSEADTYYESIIHLIPVIKWKFYILLISKCQWSSYFFECAQRLPMDVLKVVLSEIFEASKIEEMKLYSLHLGLELIIRTSCLNSSNEHTEPWPSFFSFSCSDSVLDINKKTEYISEEYKKLEYIMENQANLLKILQSNMQKDSQCLWVHLHALKTLFLNLNKIEMINAVSLLDKFTSLCKITIEYISSYFSPEMLCSAMTQQANFHSVQTNSVYVHASWGINEIYLTFLIYYYWTDFELKKMTSKSTDASLDCIKNKFILETGIKTFHKMLCSINPLLNKSSTPLHHISFLEHIFVHNFPCADRAGENLLSRPHILNNRIISTLNKYYTLFNPFHVYPLVLNAIMELKHQSKKENLKLELLKLLHKMLPLASLDIYDEVLKYTLINYGVCEDFNLPDFPSQIKMLQCKAFSMEEAKTILLPLFIQSPKLMLNYVIEEVLLQGYEGEILVQTLKFIPSSCTYIFEDYEKSPLIDVLKSYFEKHEWKPTEAKNISVLIKLLLKVNLEKNLITLDAFFSSCISPYLRSMNNIEIVLDCLNASLEVLKDADNVQMSSSCLKDLVLRLGVLIDVCINFEKGKIKGLAAIALEFLNEIELKHGILKDESKLSLREELSTVHPAVLLYVDAFLKNDDTSNLPVTSLWIASCISKSTSFLDKTSMEKLSYVDMLNILIQLLPHFSSSEWLHSMDLVKLCLTHSSLMKDTFQNVDPLFEFSEEYFLLYAAVKCFIESFGFLLQEFEGDINFLYSCFTNTLMITLKGEKCLDSKFLLNIFLDLCHLISSVASENFCLFSSILIDLAKIVTSTSDVENFNDTEEIMIQALKHLPDAEDENSLLKTLIKSLK